MASRIKPVGWDKEAVVALLNESGRDFARFATPRGWRKSAKQHLLPPGRKRLEGNCFTVSMHLAAVLPERYYYCEGYAAGTPHAWLGVVGYDGWCLDLTWPFYTIESGARRILDDHHYCGVMFDPAKAHAWQQERIKRVGPGVHTSVSLLMHLDECRDLVIST